MNQKSVVVRLRDLTKNDHPFGNSEGKEVFRKLLHLVERTPGTVVFGISLDGIEATDASFPRESVISVAKQLRGEKGFYLVDLSNRDLIDNWSYAARAKEQPLVIWNKNNFEIIGPELNESTRELVEYVLSKGAVLASQAASDLGLSVPNASTRLKNLVAQGFIRRTEGVADSGGIEYRYSAIK
ncbi:Predicted transcriptional regulator [Burkholderia pseudomallei]|uniref:helix-turn-helix domain-containing protein n=1 Tax=Burkholderia pseudomallei TaxID=28450 RepID=UPI0021F6F74B|nr:helix-turn-helix domain-containing protein [Burkholderia pseudomallei]MCW0161145.1 MarR family transcriptional regulator [Burkholderia pseudomallei]MDY7815196.1 helix-turn-helix domain-containing protein [Burkholderia pseudomallei]MDY7861757.1 helix-turn-helix domain-containing protein [Burkholderia pseudomallei]CAJ3177372.1 Predicted transcriptional regulator [Burkholderia pseudomallei]CAJ9831558.1 Predicted transcriptional regulator [Burkholderia pseudomallei]